MTDLTRERLAVAWRVHDFADGWIWFHDEAKARAYADEHGALLQPLYPSASGGVSGKDGELIARLQDIHDNDWRVAHLAHTSDTALEAKRRILALRAERDGLKADRFNAEEALRLAIIESEELKRQIVAMEDTPPDAALTDALGLLRDCHLTTDGNYLYVGGDQDEREWLARRDALLTRHSK